MPPCRAQLAQSQHKQHGGRQLSQYAWLQGATQHPGVYVPQLEDGVVYVYEVGAGGGGGRGRGAGGGGRGAGGGAHLVGAGDCAPGARMVACTRWGGVVL